MDPSELRRVELLHSHSTDKPRERFILNFKKCGIKVSKSFWSSLLVAHFPSVLYGLALKNGGSLDGRYVQNNKVAIASLFGVVSTIFRQNFKEGDVVRYLWLIDKINSPKIKTETSKTRPSDDFCEELKAVRDASAAIRIENDRLRRPTSIKRGVS